jgi:hypothetical protein
MRFDWTRTVTAVSTAAMEASWVYILLFVVTVRPSEAFSQPVLHPLAVFGLLAGSLAYTALVEFLGLRGRLVRVTNLVLIVVASVWLAKGGSTGHYGLFDQESWGSWLEILTDLNNAQFLRTLIGLIAALLLCLRGASLHQMELETPIRSFRLGMVLDSFAILFGAIFWLDIEGVSSPLIRAIISFFFFGLLGVAVTQLRRERLGPRERPGVRWFFILLPAIGLVLGGGILIALTFSPDLAEMVASLWRGIADVVIWLITPIVVAVYAMIALLLVLFGGPEPSSIEATVSGTPIVQTIAPMDDAAPASVEVLSAPWRFAITGVVVAVIVVGLIYLIWHFLSRTRSGDDILEERESIWSWDELSLDVQEWLKQLRQRLGWERALGLRALLEQLHGPPTTVAIRRAYIRLLLLALDRDLARREGQTPQEYLADLRQGMPEHAPESHLLTEAYVQARYDPQPAPKALAKQAEDAWQRIDQRERLRSGSQSSV